MQLDVDDSYWTDRRERLHQQVSNGKVKLARDFNGIFMSYQFQVGVICVFGRHRFLSHSFSSRTEIILTRSSPTTSSDAFSRIALAAN